MNDKDATEEQMLDYLEIRIVKREDLQNINILLGNLYNSRGVKLEMFREKIYSLWKRIKEAYGIE